MHEIVPQFAGVAVPGYAPLILLIAFAAMIAWTFWTSNTKPANGEGETFSNIPRSALKKGYSHSSSIQNDGSVFAEGRVLP